MTGYAAQTRDAWRDGQSLDIHDEMMRLTLRVVAKTLFDADVADEVDAIGRAMDVSVGMFARAMSPWGPILNKLPLPSNFRFARAWARLNDTIDRFIAERRGAGKSRERDDLLSRLLRATDAEGDGAGMSDRQLRDEAITLFTAGHETTANALTFTFYLLSQNPRAEAGLHAELDRVLAGRDPTADDVDLLPFTRMVLCESMRLYPPAWAVARQVVEPCTVSGYLLPNNAVILLSQWVTQRDARWWVDPLKFDPERFREDERSTRPRWSYFPFGGGSRGCIGESFAWMEAILVIATIARRWTLRFEGSGAPPLRPLITLRPAGPVRMSVTAR
jgi:cytochrome P450